MATLLNYADVAGAIDSVVALESEITTDVGSILGLNLNTAAAFPYLRYDSGVYPKWLNGVTNVKPDFNGIFEEADQVTALIELQLGKITEGYDGDLEQQFYVWIPYTLAVFKASPRLQSNAIQTIPKGLLDASLRLADEQAPGNIIAARFILTMNFYVHNAERNF